jgi:predicted naringenin-chalcone synthase
MSLAIAAIGTALPRDCVSQEDACEVARILCACDGGDTSIIPSLYRHTGIASRRMVIGKPVVDDVLAGSRGSASPFLPALAPGDRGPTTAERMEKYRREAGPLALEAARRALKESGLQPGEITHLVTVTCTGFSAPGVDLALIRGLELSRSVERTQIGFMGCHAAINGLRVARAYLGADPQARVLLSAVELCSLHYFYGWDPKRAVANALFADGAAALVGVPAEIRSDWRISAVGSSLFPGSEGAMTWDIGDHGFEMTLSTKVPSLIAANLRPWLVDWLAKQGLKIPDVPSWAVHPGGPRVLDAVQESLGLRADACDASRWVFRECGNMSSPTVLFVLERLRTARAPLPCVALGFGPGLVVEAAIFT